MSVKLSDAEIEEFHRKFLACWCPDCNKAAQFIAAVKDVRKEKKLQTENYNLRKQLDQYEERLGPCLTT
jgi:thiol-disulfide isomerase/thioredoxin